MDKTNWTYIISEEIPEILGSGSEFRNQIKTNNFEKALSKLGKCGRNHLSRQTTINGKIIKQTYDFYRKIWLN